LHNENFGGIYGSSNTHRYRQLKKLRASRPSVSTAWPEILHLSYSAAEAVGSVSLSFAAPCSL